jgi:hypothetical protein
VARSKPTCARQLSRAVCEVAVVDVGRVQIALCF